MFVPQGIRSRLPVRLPALSGAAAGRPGAVTLGLVHAEIDLHRLISTADDPHEPARRVDPVGKAAGACLVAGCRKLHMRASRQGDRISEYVYPPAPFDARAEQPWVLLSVAGRQARTPDGNRGHRTRAGGPGLIPARASFSSSSVTLTLE